MTDNTTIRNDVLLDIAARLISTSIKTADLAECLHDETKITLARGLRRDEMLDLLQFNRRALRRLADTLDELHETFNAATFGEDSANSTIIPGLVEPLLDALA